eukprot:m.124846 g.124846  ORF g.124846 m.124846 type:complete len:84 (+) comp17300_c0_seq2:609-860(+)
MKRTVNLGIECVFTSTPKGMVAPELLPICIPELLELIDMPMDPFDMLIPRLCRMVLLSIGSPTEHVASVTIDRNFNILAANLT